MLKMSKRFSVRDIVIIGMLAGLCIIATSIKIPYGAGAMVHLGTAAIYTSAILFGGKKAGLAAGIGSALFDIIMGLMTYTIWSFFIKGIAGFIVGSIANSGEANGKSVVRNAIACIAGALWTLAGYLVAWSVVQGGLNVAITNIPSSLISSSVGFVIALPLATLLKNALKKYQF